MVKKREEDDLNKAHHIVATKVKKAQNHAKRVFLEAAKAAQHWRRSSVLENLEISDGNGLCREKQR